MTMPLRAKKAARPVVNTRSKSIIRSLDEESVGEEQTSCHAEGATIFTTLRRAPSSAASELSTPPTRTFVRGWRSEGPEQQQCILHCSCAPGPAREALTTRRH